MTSEMTNSTGGIDPDSAIGERIRFAMRRRGISQKELAETLHADRALISKKVSGQRPWYFHEIDAVAGALGIHVAELVGGTAPAGWETPNPADDLARPKGFEPLTFWLGVSAGRNRPKSRHLTLVQDTTSDFESIAG